MQIDIEVVATLNTNNVGELSVILLDAVASNASVGFLANLTSLQVQQYWQAVAQKIGNGHVILLAKHNKKIVGTVQLIMALQSNAYHRAEIAKLLVHSEYQGNSIAKQLMKYAEDYAIQNGVKLLVLDTQTGSKAEQLYTKLGWNKSGEIPHYALNPVGAICTTSYFYKLLTHTTHT